jgi:hypothetical protein
LARNPSFQKNSEVEGNAHDMSWSYFRLLQGLVTSTFLILPKFAEADHLQFLMTYFTTVEGQDPSI